MIDVGCHIITAEDYHADPCPVPSLSRSVIKSLLFQSPAHVKEGHPRLNPALQSENEGKFDIGTACHALLLEGIDNIVVVDADSWRGKDAKEERDAAYLMGQTPLLKHQYESALIMVKEAERQIAACPELKIKNLREEGDSELTYIWKEEGTYLRVRPDWISKDRKLILDYKTTAASANPEEWGKTGLGSGCDIQEALYKRGVKAIEGTEPKFIFVVQENYPPYLCSFIGLPPQFSEMGSQKIWYGIYLWKKAMESGEWPGYPNRVAWIEPPTWALASWDSRASNIGEEGLCTHLDQR